MATTTTEPVKDDTEQTTASEEAKGSGSAPSAQAPATGKAQTPSGDAAGGPTRTAAVDIEALLNKQNERLTKKTAELEAAKQKLKQYEAEAKTKEQPVATEAKTEDKKDEKTNEAPSKAPDVFSREEVERMLAKRDEDMQTRINEMAAKAAKEAAEEARKQIALDAKKEKLVRDSGIVMVDLVTGSTEAELEASVKLIQEKEAQIRKTEAERSAAEFRALLPKGVQLPGEAKQDATVSLRELSRTNPEAYRAELAKRGFNK